MLTICPLCTHSQGSRIDQDLRASRELRPLADVHPEGTQPIAARLAGAHG